MTRSKVLFHANAPWCATGYGTQTALFVPAMANLGYDPAVSAFHGLSGACRPWADPTGREFTVYPSGGNAYGNDVMGAHFKHWAHGEKGIFWILTDPWVLFANLVQRLPAASWCPVDHDPLIPITATWFKDSHAIPVAMSRFGERVFRDAELDPVYVPHAFDPAIFFERDRTEARADTAMPDDVFLVGMVAANKGIPCRKGFAEAFAAMSVFGRRHADVRFYVHTQVKVVDGEDLIQMAKTFGIKPMIPQQYMYSTGLIDDNHLSKLMSCFDVLLNPSYGEGFGLTILEAQACGTPVIATNSTSMPEVVGPAGWLVDGQKRWTNFGSWQVTPDVDGIVAALEEAYAENAEDRAMRRLLTRAHAEQYTIANVEQDHLKGAMDEIVQRLDWNEVQSQIRSN